MLGSIQDQGEELEEAMQIYELAIKDLPVLVMRTTMYVR
jgi:hypothetical protein